MGDHAVSEVVGQILMFGILSMVLILSLTSFNIAKEEAENRVLGTVADSVAQRVASLVVETALFAEEFQDDGVSLQSLLELPSVLENHGYKIELRDAGTPAALHATQVVVTIPRTGHTGSAPLFSAGSAGIVHVCVQEPIEGGDVRIQVVRDSQYPFNEAPFPDGDANVDDGAGVPQLLAACDALTPESEFYIYLEPAQ